MLLIDGVPQSHVDLDDPGYLEFEYVRRLGHVIDLAAPAGQPLRVLHLGAGALTLARYVAATRPASRQARRIRWCTAARFSATLKSSFIIARAYPSPPWTSRSCWRFRSRTR